MKQKDGKFEQKSEHRGIGEGCLGAAENKFVGALRKHEVMEGIIDSFDEVFMKELSKADAPQSGCSNIMVESRWI